MATKYALLVAASLCIVTTACGEQPAGSSADVLKVLPSWDGGGVVVPEQTLAIRKKGGWIVASLTSGRATLEWEIVLAKEQPAVEPMIDEHPVWKNVIAVRYGSYFIRESNGNLRVFREVKKPDDLSWRQLQPIDPKSVVVGTKGLNLVAQDEWRWLAACPRYDAEHCDCRIRFQHESLGKGQGAGGSADGFQYVFFGSNRCQDEGDLLIAERLPSYFADAELRTRAAKDAIPGSPMPAITGMRIGGDAQTFDATELTGKVVLIEFWAPWCGPCVEKMPTLDRLSQKYRDRGLAVVGVHSSIGLDNGSANEEAAKFLSVHPVSYPIVIGDKETERRFAVDRLPAFFLIDRDGVVVESSIGEIPSEDRIVAELGKPAK